MHEFLRCFRFCFRSWARWICARKARKRQCRQRASHYANARGDPRDRREAWCAAGNLHEDLQELCSRRFWVAAAACLGSADEATRRQRSRMAAVAHSGAGWRAADARQRARGLVPQDTSPSRLSLRAARLVDHGTNLSIRTFHGVGIKDAQNCDDSPGRRAARVVASHAR